MDEIVFTEDEIAEIKKHMRQYAFYKKAQSRISWYCSNCEKWYEEYYGSDDIYYDPVPSHFFKHNDFMDCPHCKMPVIAKSIGRGFRTLEDNGCFVVCRNIEGRFRMFVSKVKQCFDNNCSPIRSVEPRYLYEFDEDGKLHKYSWNCMAQGRGWHWQWRENKSLTPFPHDSWVYNYHYDEAVLINPESFESTAQRYCCAEYFVGPYYSARDFVAYICLYAKHPNIEYIVKQDFGKVIASLLNKHQSSVYINWRSNNLLKMLGIRSKDDIESCRKMEPDQLTLYRKLSKIYSHMAELVLKVSPNFCCSFWHIHESTGLSPQKILNYMSKLKNQNIFYWADYLDMAVKAYGDAFEYRPKDIVAAHDRCVAILNARKEEIARKFNEARTNKLKAFIYQEEGLTIVLPQSVKDIVDEGKALSHCVAGYAERHFKGQTTILFLRRADEPDKPYYTIELTNAGKIKQCYGYRNNTAGNPKPPEIETFEQHYEEYLQEVIYGKRNKRTVQQSA